MTGRMLGLWVGALALAACSDDGVASSGSTTSGGDGDPFMTTLPPMTSDPPPPATSDGDTGGELDETSGGVDPTADSTTGDPGPTNGTDTDTGTGTGTTGDDTASTGATVEIPGEGALVISEIMQNPAVLMDSEGEWFELHNPSATDTFQLMGCTIEGSMVDTAVPIDVDLPIGPGAYLTFAVDFAGGPGFMPDFTWPGNQYTLNNTSDVVTLVCDGNVVDAVAYDNGATFPDPNGASMNLDPGSLDTVANDDGMNWCEATTDYNGDLGTPGAANDACP